ncbi:MAG TPA: hypothetical protein VKC64_03065 [Burkholderiales bacterium]|nr:hypothetical protein [Burkholderiales bacterium]
MSNRNLLAALVLAAASSAVFAAPAISNSQVVEGKAACATQVDGTARQAAEVEACDQYQAPHGQY